MIAQFPNVLQYKNTPIATQLSYLIPVHSPHLNIKFVLLLILESRWAKLLESTKRSWRGRNTSGGRGRGRYSIWLSRSYCGSSDKLNK